MLKRLLKRPGTQALLAAAAGRYLAFALRTTHWTLHGEAHLAPFLAAPAIAAFWHERLPLMPALWLHASRQPSSMRANVLVSRHRDGRFIADIMRRFGVNTVHGSTARNGVERGGAAGMRAMLAVLQAGEHVVITPDGPRGPRRDAAPGVAHLAAVSGIAVLPCAAQTTRRRVLPSWDRMLLPLPWGRGTLVCLPAIQVGREEADAALPAIAAALTEAANLADRLCAA